MPDVNDLQDPEYDPINSDKDVAQRERSGVVAMGGPVMAMIAVDRGVVDVANSGGELQDERQQGQDLVGGNVTPSAFGIAGKRIR